MTGSRREESGRNVVAAGGTGALGSAVVRAFLASGDRVWVPWVDERQRARTEQAEAEAVKAGQLVLVDADVAEAAGAEAVAKAAGEIDVLVNGVGGFGGGTPVHETDLALWDHLYRLNVRAAVAMSRAALPGMLARRRGVVLNVAAQVAWTRPALLAAYTASKSAVLVLTETLQKEVAGHGVRVNAIAPSTIDTPANREAMPDADFSAWTPPERIAAVLHWLASDAAAAVRGAVIPV